MLSFFGTNENTTSGCFLAVFESRFLTRVLFYKAVNRREAFTPGKVQVLSCLGTSWTA